MRFFIPIFQMFVLFCGASAKADELLSKQQAEFINLAPRCETDDSCNLRKFRIEVRETKTQLKEYHEDHFVNLMIASYETSSVESLEEFAIVQFTRGCVFDSQVINGELKKNIDGRLRRFFGLSQVYYFPDWAIDSQDSNPMYNSDEETAAGRILPHRLYRWNTVEGSFEKATQKFYGSEKPSVPMLYVKDVTSSAFVRHDKPYQGLAYNNSLLFKTCIYKTKDIPRETTQDNVNFAKPIYCFDWKSSLVYDHQKNRFERPEELDPFCLQKR
jgi:hypothetical protein